jgi:membrane protease YdiL (CAAX protease family)
MSILAAASVSDSGTVPLVPWIIFVVIALAGAAVTGLFSARAVSGPYRLPVANGALLRLMLAATIGVFVWLLSQQLYMQIRHPSVTTTQPAAVTEAELSPLDWVFVSTVPPWLGFTAVVAADVALLGGASEVERLGLRRDPLPGAARGLVGILIASPMIWFVSSITEWAYEVRHYVHPQEHELLKVMGDTTSPAARTALIIGAVILAPLFEETIFRAHVQTFLRELLCKLSGVLPVVSAPSKQEGVEEPLPFAEVTRNAADPGVSVTPSRTVVWQTWTAILIASALFTMVHPRWMWPPIFFLAICLGYAYERTGNLWTSIVMHSLFNATSTYLFLSQGH